MITDKIENLHKYACLFSGISDVVKVRDSKSLNDILEKETFGDVVMIPIKSAAIAENFDTSLLEAHKTLMDIHITLEGTDVIAYANLDDEATISKEYDNDNDYLLAKSNTIKTLSVPKGYFCIIPNNFAHMALYQGHSDVKKIVVKMSSNS